MQVKTPIDAIRHMRAALPEGGRIYAPGCSAELTAFVEAFEEEPAMVAGLTFAGVWIPGINNVDYAGLHKEARAETIFLSPPLRESFKNGALDFRPLSYTQTYADFETADFKAALFQVTPPDEDGLVSLGVSADFAPAIWQRDEVFRVAQINPAMPRPKNSPALPIDAFDITVELETPILNYAPQTLPDVFKAIAENIASLIDDGDTLQFGLGNVQLAVLRALAKKQNLRIHSGMISDPVLEAVDAGAIASDESAITTGVALGGNELYSFCAKDPRQQFLPVCDTHAMSVLNSIENFVAINSVVEVDLLGQANAEYVKGQQVSGAGGLVDFLRGAAASKGGKPIIALASTAKRGAVSRIVPQLSAPSVSIARADVGIVVTECGIADLRGKTIEERARSLIAIAHPDHRETLKAEWRKLESSL